MGILEARVERLEAALERFQDAIDRQAVLRDERLDELDSRTEAHLDLSRDARKRGL